VVRLGLLAVAGTCIIRPGSALGHQGLHEAIAGVTAQIERDPRNPKLYLSRGELHREHGDFDAALSDCDQAARLDPESAEVSLVRGRVFLDAGWLQSAELAVARYVGKRPDEARGHEILGEIANRRGDPARAAREFARAIELQPRPAPELYLARVRAMSADGKNAALAASPIAVLDEGMKRLGGPIVTLQIEAIELELRQGQYDSALARVRTLAAQSERKEQWHVLRGDILRRAGRPDQAKQAYRDALTAIGRLSPARRQTPAVVAITDHARAALGDLESTPATSRPSQGEEQHVNAIASATRPAR
jgi:predicted Zn-dependent protease